ncbi:transglutaminase-like domain-containing protein [Pseudoruegeria sp. HB172150]|uniref:transglutaminase-like domain-containing protein n=1 Tax=Pseudoruegeria sp. HB172150 TaxID=2721164 RepID=UPI001551BA3D|nr:transglutaminase-like domain-containing protein [Pseudoruegeria sp. HB172150]
MTSEFEITVTVDNLPPGALVLAACGQSTPHAVSRGCDVSGGQVRHVTEAATGLPALAISAAGPALTLRYRYEESKDGTYPEAMFHPTASRYTRAAEALLAEASDIAGTGPDDERSRRIACAVAERFTYGHPDIRFNDGMDEVPLLGCGLTEGSCVDINTYFIASLRAAGIEAGYITGCFFPAEKRDWCEDMHCWVVTRIDDVFQEWDIAHYLKLGSRDIAPALNPKPGFRAALAHSMGLDFPELGVREVKLLSEPILLRDGRAERRESASIRLRHPALTDIQPTEATL